MNNKPDLTRFMIGIITNFAQYIKINRFKPALSGKNNMIIQPCVIIAYFNNTSP